MINKPIISVIMGVHNCERTVASAIASIQQQTFSDWELIVCDDGSDDSTYSIIRRLAEEDGRIKIIQNQKNLGLNDTLNRCLDLAKGKYIARMDGDDISLPQRFEHEYETLERNSSFSIVSCPMEFFDDEGIWGRNYPKEYPQPIDFVKNTPICHAPCMIRTEALKAVKGYSKDKRTIRVEDYDLWFRMYEKGYKAINLTDPYYLMRDDKKAYKRRKFKYALNEAHVRLVGYKRLKLPISSYFYVLRPILISFLPYRVYLNFHRKKK